MGNVLEFNSRYESVQCVTILNIFFEPNNINLVFFWLIVS